MNTGSDYFLNPLSSYDYAVDSAKSSSDLKKVQNSSNFASQLAERLKQGKGDSRKTVDDRRLLDVCHEMEALFIGVMLKTMRSTIEESDFFGKSMAKDIFRDIRKSDVQSITCG